MHRAIALTVLALVAAPHALSAADAPLSLEQRADQHLQAFQKQQQIPGLSMAVGLHHKVVYTKAFGVTDLEKKTPLTTSSIFPLGSTTKILTSLALGKLIEQRKINIDAPIQTYVPYFPKKDFPLTVSLLAGHLSGLRDYDMSREYANEKEFHSVKEEVAVFQNDPLLFEPGTKYAYSAYNFVLLSAAIEGASKRDFLSFVREQITAPLHLQHTGPDRTPAPMPGLVTSYQRGMFAPMKTAPINISNKWAAGGFVSTSTEMVQLGDAMLNGEVIEAETFNLLTNPQKLKDGTINSEGYGMGWRSSRVTLNGKEHRVMHHGGTANGAMSFFAVFPDDELVISLNSNLLFQPFNTFSKEAFAIAEMFLAESDAKN